jgi:hypothetical protein
MALSPLGHENDEGITAFENCGASRDDDIGDSGDNRDSEESVFF